MNASNEASGKMTPWYVRPRVVLPLLAALLIVTVLFTPDPSAGNDDPRISTYSAQPEGGRLLYELADRLGWSVGRSTSTRLPLDSSSIVAVLAPVVQLRAREVHDLLEHVRGGGALLVGVERGATAIADSLGLERTIGGDAPGGRTLSRACPASPKSALEVMRAAGQAPRYLSALKVKPASPLVPDTLLSVRVKRDNVVEAQPVVLSSTLGRGRIVVLGSSTVLRNRALRECTTGFDILAVRALEYLSAGQGSRELNFDEYHQGYGSHAGSLPAILAEFAGTRSGRMFFQLAGAGVLLLLAFAPRALPPREAPPPDRRSPLEHVDALARAYQQVGATRTATSRLVRGLRRRVDHGVVSARSTQSDAQFLDHIIQHHPSLRAEVNVLRVALEGDVDRAQWSALPESVDRIERTLTRK